MNTSGTCVEALSLEGVSQMDSILPERLPALVRPGNDLVLRRIQSLKRCVQACGCKIMTPRYAPQFGSRLHFKRPLFPFFRGPLFCNPFFLSFFGFFLALWPQRKCGRLPRELPSKACAAEAALGSSLHEVVQVEVARDERGGLASGWCRGSGSFRSGSPHPTRSAGAD